MDFNTWKEFYGWGFASKEQLQQAVKQNILTIAQYKEITGDDYIITVPSIKPSEPATTNIQPADVKPIVPDISTQPVDIKPIIPEVTTQPKVPVETINPTTQTIS
ncbi:MAG: XkdX family protein [Sarcina sp.]